MKGRKIKKVIMRREAEAYKKYRDALRRYGRTDGYTDETYGAWVALHSLVLEITNGKGWFK